MVRDSGGGFEPGESTVTSVVTVVWELDAEARAPL
jgi:hypothetical protein